MDLAQSVLPAAPAAASLLPRCNHGNHSLDCLLLVYDALRSICNHLPGHSRIGFIHNAVHHIVALHQHEVRHGEAHPHASVHLVPTNVPRLRDSCIVVCHRAVLPVPEIR